MRTHSENACTDSARFHVHFPVMFRSNVRELAGSGSGKANKTAVFKGNGKMVNGRFMPRLGLHRANGCNPFSFVISAAYELSEFSGQFARHRFCTTLVGRA